MAAPTKPVLDDFYTVEKAAARLGLCDPDDPEDKRGQSWLRTGVNDKTNPFPCHRLSGQLMFSDSDLAEIAERHRNKPEARGRHTRRNTRQAAVATATVPAQRSNPAA